MSESSIWVKPSTEANRVKVKTELVGDVEVPVYAQADSDGALISDDNPTASIQSVYLIDGFETTTGITGSTDVSNIAQSTDHLGVGQYSTSFDKSGTTQAFALIEKTITAIDLTRFTGTYDVEFAIKLPSLTDVSLVYVALGSSSSNAIYWQTSVTDLVAGWNTVNKGLKYPEDQVGDGIDYSSISWIGIYVGFNSTANTLTGIKADNIELHPTTVHKLEDISDASPDTITKDGRKSQYTVAGFSDTQSMHFDVKTSSTLIAYMLIDISNTAVWKHTSTGEIIIEYIIIQVDPDTNFQGEVKLGYLTNVDATNGDFNQILDVDMSRKSGLFHENMDFGTHGIHCADDSHFGLKIADSALFQTDVNLGGPDAPGTPTYPSGDNDLALIIDGDGTNTVAVSITIGYETVA